MPFKGDCGKCGAKRIDRQLGLERTPEEYVERLVAVFEEVRRVLRRDGVLWLNLGDSYAGSPVGSFNGGGFSDRSAANGTRNLSGFKTSGALNKLAGSGLKPKDLVGIPWSVAFALRARGWWLRRDVIWSKPNPMPESVTDRPTTSHEYLFILTKAARYYWDKEAVRERAICGSDLGLLRGKADSGDGRVSAHAPSIRSRQAIGIDSRTANQSEMRNIRSVWSIATQPFPEAHFATFPPALAERCIRAASKEGDTVLDPFSGAGTAGLVALRLNRRFVGIELNPAYCAMARRRIYDDAPLLRVIA